ncbi:MAG: hypothetical protein KKH98_01250, partial [Spirochaetes bacterium]|nr:hypothetical protein [Spirochaetota bacterium]
WLFCVSSAFAEEYEIKLSRPIEKGKKFRLDASSHTLSLMTEIEDGKVKDEKRIEMTVNFIARVEVLAVDEEGQITRASYTVEKLDSIDQGKVKSLLSEGEIIIADTDDNKTDFIVDEKHVGYDLEMALQQVVSQGSGTKDDKIFGTKDKKKIGDKWEIDSEYAALDMQSKKIEVKKEFLYGTVSLDDIVKVNGIECLQLQAQINVDKMDIPMPDDVQVEEVTVKAGYLGKFPLDQSYQALETVREMTFYFKARGTPGTDDEKKRMEATMENSLTTKIEYLK